MPPSREFKIVIDPEVQKALEAALQIRAHYRVKISASRNNAIFGRHHFGHRMILINTGVDLFANSSLRAVKHEILDTLLHEFRHAHQHDNWTPERIEADKKRPYSLQEMEADANRWAEENTARWTHLFRIRPVSGNNLARLARAERQVTQR